MFSVDTFSTRLIFLFLLFFILIPSHVAADLIKGTASGTVTYATARNIDMPGSIKAGDPVTVTWQYDTDYATDRYPDSEATGAYSFTEAAHNPYPRMDYDAFLAINHKSFITVRINDLVWAAGDDDFYITVANNANNANSGTLDAFILSISAGGSSIFPGLLGFAGGEFRINDKAAPLDMLIDKKLPVSMSDINFDEVTHAFGSLYSLELIPLFDNTDEQKSWSVSYSVDLSTFQFRTHNPAVGVTIALSGGETQECNSPDGNEVLFTANITLGESEEIETIQWSVDGEYAGNDITIMPILGLGSHTVEVIVTTYSNNTASATAVVEIKDTTAPVIEVSFSDSRTGEVVTLIDNANVQWIMANYKAIDACDYSPVTLGDGGFPVNNGDLMKIMGATDQIVLTAPVIDLTVTSTDNSGNVARDTATLEFVE